MLKDPNLPAWLLGILPLGVLVLTTSVKISITFAILKNALGMERTLPSSAILVFSLVLSFFVVSPIIESPPPDPTSPLGNWEHSKQAWETFLNANSSSKHKDFFIEEWKRRTPTPPQEQLGTLRLNLLLPAFMATELEEAFRMGFYLYLPFLFVEFLAAIILAAAGLHNMSAKHVSLPFKLLLFLSVGGFDMLLKALLHSYQT